MALSRRSGARFQANIWPGFVDAMTALLLVLMFVLSIFMIVQFMLRETITGQESELLELNAEVDALARALGLEQQDNARLEDRVGALGTSLTQMQGENAQQRALIATLNTQLTDRGAALDAAAAQITDFEARVAALLSDKANLEGQVTGLLGEKADFEDQVAGLLAQNAQVSSARDAAQASAAELRDRLLNSEDEVTALTLALENQRKRAEDTLTLLAAAEAAQARLDEDLTLALAAQQAAEKAISEQQELRLSESQKQALLLSTANDALASEEAKSAEAARKVALLNQQLSALRTQLSNLQGLLDDAQARDAESNVQLEALGSQLNAALAQAASEQRRRAALEEAERIRLEEEAKRLAEEAAKMAQEAAAQAEKAKDLENYKSEFFGRLREVLADREGVRVVGDRFVFSSEVLFSTASADLAPEGREQIANVAAILTEVAGQIPPEIDWIIRVDGHTDNVPLSGRGRYRDNWELSQARALSVVRYLTEELGFDPRRLAATGFGEYAPVNPDDTPEARAQNRRIELKLTER